jgi:iron transport multicopper oxidase
MDPNIVASSNFQSIWTFQSPNSRELFLAKPLVYTPSGQPEMLITASEMNIVRVINAKTGAIISQRTLTTPFLSADASCPDIPNYIGVTGTPIIDPDTDIM